MDKSTTNIKKNKLNKCLKYLALVQLAILIIVFYTLISKYYNFECSGNTLTEQQPFAKCDFAYKCECPKYSKKCNCIYYNYNEQPERIKCYNYN